LASRLIDFVEGAFEVRIAKALGLKLPLTLQVAADEVIE
jgi:hypothetical protein